MASPSLLRSPTRPNGYVCATCAFRASQAPIARRSLHLRYLARQNEAKRQWDANAAKILSGEKKSMLTHLEERGLVHAIAGNRDDVDLAMTKHRLGVYVGIDPTASSLHIGHLLPLMSLFWMYVHGYHTVSLLGGATAKIGDPTDRLTTREKQQSSIRTANMVAMHYQLKKLWGNVESYGRKYGFTPKLGISKRELVNNIDWMNKLTLMEVLQILGPGIRLGPMLARETVKNKMAKGDGMSFAEFTYPLLQGWDWWHMYHTKGIQMQIGGSDQFGNITAGIDVVKYISKTHPYHVVHEKIENHPEPFGFTVPLLTTSAGQKFGKSAGNAVWLDKEQTSTFDLYGFFMRTSDEDVGRYLKLFTFLPIESIDAVMKEHLEDPKQRKAQHLLAREFLELVHGVEEAKAAEVQHRLMFNNANATPPPASYYASAANGPEGSLVPEQIVLNNAPKANVKLPLSLIQRRSVARILYAAGLASSSSDGHRIASSESAYIGGHPGGKKEPGPMGQGGLTFTSVKLWLPEETQNFLIDDKLLILRRGKHNVRIIEVVSDEEYAQLGLKYPGMPSNALQKESDSDAPVIGTDSLKQNASVGKVKKEGRRTRVKRKALEAYERHEAYKKKREEWKDNFLTREKASKGGKEEASPQKETRRDPIDAITEWKNPHYHPHMIVSKGQLKGGNQLPFYPKKIGEPIPRPQPIPPTPTPAIVQKSYERFASAQPPKSKPSIPAKYVETAEYNPPQLKSLIDQKTRPWGLVSDLPVRQK